ncbi:MAG: carotenoid biosynthesis protein [Thaumarchaeota archaeon]|nr:carotenoid biosynthesis protein [Nitrososphaerota archaeon]
MSTKSRLATWPLTALALFMILSDLFSVWVKVDIPLLFRTISVLLIPAMAIYVASLYGWSFTSRSFLVLFLGGLGVEVLGTRTGIPFGEYFYTERFQPQILNVPVQIPLAWFTLGLMCYSLASLNSNRRLLKVSLASILMVSWDILYDPAFSAMGSWVWMQGEYFGVPLTNFLGWLLASLIFFLIIEAFANRNPEPIDYRAKLPPLTLYAAYMVDGLMLNVTLEQPIAAVIGVLAMASTLTLTHIPRLFSIKAKNT